MDKIARIKELIQILNEASKVYYQGKDEIMTNFEYDKLYDELIDLEKETGVVMNNSPSVKVGYETLSELPKEEHVAPMLSLGKTKEVSELESFLTGHDGLLSLKLDGLSVILTYENGVLSKALTRGNGEIGEVITNNAKTFVNIPKEISYKDTLVIRGEALITYSDFEKLNNETAEISEKYKNPRNLCSGAVRQLNNKITAKRNVKYFVYNVIESTNTFEQKKDYLVWLGMQGFDVVPYKEVNESNIADAVKEFENEITKNDLPSDGLVLTFDNVEYSASLGRTAKFPRDSIAFKWQDETADTSLLEIEWSASRTGLINPVAIFEPVELEGTTVQRASLHNLSIVEELELGIGDTISVYKANMIIPQISENKTKSNNIAIPEKCPICGMATKIVKENDTKVLKCLNEECAAKKIKAFSHFVSRDAMNIEGLSEATIEKLINLKLLNSIEDIFDLEKGREKFINLEGLGEKSFNNLIKAIDEAKMVSIANLLNSLGIKGVGLTNAKLITKQYPYTLSNMKNITEEMLLEIDGVGEVLAKAFVEFFANEKNDLICEKLDSVLDIQFPATLDNLLLEGKVFVITGSLNSFANRSECKEKIEQLGGKVASAVSKNTDYLINNDNTSQSSKNKKAKSLNVPIITEEEFLAMII